MSTLQEKAVVSSEEIVVVAMLFTNSMIWTVNAILVLKLISS